MKKNPKIFVTIEEWEVSEINICENRNFTLLVTARIATCMHGKIDFD